MNAWQKVIWLDERNAELLELLAEALEHLQEYDDYSLTSHHQLERKIDDVVNPREEETT